MSFSPVVNPVVDFSEYQDEAGQYALTKNVMDNGYCVIKNCENFKDSVFEIASKIAVPQSTMYGFTQEIKTEPTPRNIAFSGIYLGPHMDFPYYESPPGISFMLCRRNDESVQGGESILIDAFEVAEEIRRCSPEDFKVLCEVPVRYQKIHWDRDDPVYMEWEQPHIVVDSEGTITRINWGPAFEGKSKNDSMTAEYLKAYRLFLQKVNESPTKTVRKLEAGECLVFNNRRMLHGRNEFELNGGTRLLELAFLNICEFRSRAQILEITQGDGELVKMIGNQNTI